MSSSVTGSPAVAAVHTAISSVMVDDLEEVAVLDGIDDQQAYATRSVTVAGTWDPDTQQLSTFEVVTVETAESGATRRNTESTFVQCIAYSGGEGLDLAGHRGRVNEMLSAVRNALRRVGEVDGSAAAARITDQRWAQVVDEQGMAIIALFTIAVTVLP